MPETYKIIPEIVAKRQKHSVYRIDHTGRRSFIASFDHDYQAQGAIDFLRKTSHYLREKKP